MTGVNELFEFFGGAESGGGGEEVGDVIAEGAVVGVFHNTHKLNGVVPGLNDAGQSMFTKFCVGANLRIFLRHADVGFVYEGVVNTFFWVAMAPGVGGGRIPDLGRKDVGLWILNGTPGVSWNPLAVASGPKYLQFVEVFVLDGF